MPASSLSRIALYSAVRQMDDEVKRTLGATAPRAGGVAAFLFINTPANMSALTDRRIYFANIGDTEMILGQSVATAAGPRRHVEVLSKKHVASDPDEARLVKARGGTIQYNGHSHYVMSVIKGGSAVMPSRAFGDFHCKPSISAIPHVGNKALEPQDDFIVIASDGLWDQLTYKDAVDIVYSHLAAGKAPKEAAHALIRASNEKGKHKAKDNVSCLVLFLKSHELIGTGRNH